MNFFIALGESHCDEDVEVASEFVCRMYGQSNTADVNEARHKKLMQMSGNINKVIFRLVHYNLFVVGSSLLSITHISHCLFQDNPLEKVKKIDCALLPPCRRSLHMKLKRAKYVAILWTHASSASPGNNLSPADYGWYMNKELLQPKWFDGPAIPVSLFKDDEEEEEKEEEEKSLSIRDTSSDEEEASEMETSDDKAWSEDSDDSNPY